MSTEQKSQDPFDVRVRVMATPNPNALKFIVNKLVKAEGKATFSRPSEAMGVPLAEDQFMVDGVRQLHFFENVVTVTYAEDADVDTLRIEVIAHLQRRMVLHDPSFVMPDEKKKLDRSGLSPEIQKIEEILDRTVRMHLQGDGGDIEILNLDGHVLEVRYLGACGTCPSSLTGTLEAIQGILRDEFDPDIRIVTVD